MKKDKEPPELVFQKAENGTKIRWREAKASNAECPSCKVTMAVILGHQGALYAFCFRCGKYYLAE